MRIFLLATIAIQADAASVCPTVEDVPLGTVATSLEYEGRLIEVCGAFDGRDQRHASERVLLMGPDQWGYHTGIAVLDPELALGADGREVCVVGIQRRRDGLTREEARARGTGAGTVTDVPVRYPDYVFYPQPCPDGPVLG